MLVELQLHCSKKVYEQKETRIEYIFITSAFNKITAEKDALEAILSTWTSMLGIFYIKKVKFNVNSRDNYI